MIRFEDVTLTYPDGDRRITAVDRVTLTARPGQVTAVTGASGSGKSSLLALAATLIRPDSGSIRIDEVEVSDLSPAEATDLRREKVGIVFQQSNLIAAMTAVDQLRVMAELAGPAGRGDRAAARRRALDLLASVGMSAEANKYPKQLSGGQRQRVNIARALMIPPRVLVVDEPTSALDWSLGEQIIDLVLQVTKQHQTATILVTHDQTHLPAMDAVAEMRDGRLELRTAAGVATGASVRT